MDRRIAIAEGVEACKFLTARYLAGFDDSTRTHQPPGLPNHVAWSLGHLAYVNHRAAERLDRAPLPDGEFIVGGRADGGGDARRFATESVAMGSRPIDDPAQYPLFRRAVEIFDGSCDRVGRAVREASDAALDTPVKWGAVEVPGYMLAMRMMYHIGAHNGQIADIRRALGMKSIFS